LLAIDSGLFVRVELIEKFLVRVEQRPVLIE
jgi:hypothetical protein